MESMLENQKQARESMVSLEIVEKKYDLKVLARANKRFHPV